MKKIDNEDIRIEVSGFIFCDKNYRLEKIQLPKVEAFIEKYGMFFKKEIPDDIKDNILLIYRDHIIKCLKFIAVENME